MYFNREQKMAPYSNAEFWALALGMEYEDSDIESEHLNAELIESLMKNDGYAYAVWCVDHDRVVYLSKQARNARGWHLWTPYSSPHKECKKRVTTAEAALEQTRAAEDGDPPEPDASAWM